MAEPTDDSSRSEAEKFNKAMLTNTAMLVAFARLLARKYDTPDELIAAADAFITDQSRNGVADFAMVLKVQQTMQAQPHPALPGHPRTYGSGLSRTRPLTQSLNVVTPFPTPKSRPDRPRLPSSCRTVGKHATKVIDGPPVDRRPTMVAWDAPDGIPSRIRPAAEGSTRCD